MYQTRKKFDEEKTIERVKLIKPFEEVTFLYRELSFEQIGVLMILIIENNCECSSQDIANSSNDGKVASLRIIRELEQLGYVEIEKMTPEENLLRSNYSTRVH